MIVKRLITATILLALIILIVFFLPPLAWTLFVAIILFFSAWEWTGLLSKTPINPVLRIIIGLAAVLFADELFVTLTHTLLWVTALIATIWGGIAIIRYNQSTQQTTGLHRPTLKAILGVALLIPFGCAMISLFHTSEGPILLLLPLTIIWLNDSMAFVVGRSFGKNHLIPEVSPNKTWEGLAGGIVAALLWASLAGYFFLPKLAHLWQFDLIALTLIIAANIGDLIVSLLKRLVNKKDTSQLLPGHGGVLDRVDSLLTGLPIFTLGCYWAGLITN